MLTSCVSQYYTQLSRVSHPLTLLTLKGKWCRDMLIPDMHSLPPKVPIVRFLDNAIAETDHAHAVRLHFPVGCHVSCYDKIPAQPQSKTFRTPTISKKPECRSSKSESHFWLNPSFF